MLLNAALEKNLYLQVKYADLGPRCFYSVCWEAWRLSDIISCGSARTSMQPGEKEIFRSVRKLVRKRATSATVSTKVSTV